MSTVESDNFFNLVYIRDSAFPAREVRSRVLRLGSVIVEVLFASVAVIYSCALVYALSSPLEIATVFVN